MPVHPDRVTVWRVVITWQTAVMKSEGPAPDPLSALTALITQFKLDLSEATHVGVVRATPKEST